MARHSQRAKEGYLQIDHRESPGVAPSDAMATGPNIPIVGKGMNFESATVRCSQCHRIGVTHLVGALRHMDHNYCPKCDSYHCDQCMATQPFGFCDTLDAKYDRLQKEAAQLIL